MEKRGRHQVGRFRSCHGFHEFDRDPGYFLALYSIFIHQIPSANDAKKSNLTKDLGGCVTSDGTVSTQEDNSKDGPEFTALPDEVLGKLTRQTQKKIEIETNNKREMKLQRMMIWMRKPQEEISHVEREKILEPFKTSKEVWLDLGELSQAD
ncbi:hypothetical protein Tco_1104688 [Tanacetum coccineum]